MFLVDGYRSLKVYEKSFDLVAEIYQYVKTLPKEETFGLSSQMRRAAYSVPLNIAEGYGRRPSLKEYRQFLLIARGSANEMVVLVDLCEALQYMPAQQAIDYRERYIEAAKMLSGIIAKVSGIRDQESGETPLD